MKIFINWASFTNLNALINTELNGSIPKIPKELFFRYSLRSSDFFRLYKNSTQKHAHKNRSKAITLNLNEASTGQNVMYIKKSMSKIVNTIPPKYITCLFIIIFYNRYYIFTTLKQVIDDINEPFGQPAGKLKIL